ncbi:hypothetical protein PCK1_001371 [Pneumocystis canis]|nr:hypothetical protein PCK1_001371 [Pneumocystis canis]
MSKYILSLFSLDTLDGIDRSAKDIKLCMNNETSSEEELKKLKSKWKSYEFFVYYLILSLALVFCLKTTYDISSSSHHNYKWFSRYLKQGWIPGRKIDSSDIQYFKFRNNIPGLLIALVIHLSLGFLLDYFSKYIKFLRNDMQRRILYNNIYSLIYLIILHGTSTIKIYIIVCINYGISYVFSCRKLNPILTWGYSFSFFHHKLSFLDRYEGLIPRWQIHFNITVLRLISYNLDYYWSKNADGVEKQASDSQLTEKNRINMPCIEADYCLRNFLAYTFYAPLYFSGPIISFNNFISQLRYPSKSISSLWIGKYLLRFLFCFFLLEGILHFFYVTAIARTGAWDGNSLFQISMIGFFNLQIIWLKLLIIWRFFRFWALCDKIDPSENMIRCINNNYSFMCFWRAWHRTFNRWIIRYIYLPLGGSKLLAVNIFIIFTFVAFWHDISLKLFAWGWLVTLFIFPEIIVRRIFQSEKLKNWQGYRYLSAIGAAINIIMMMIVNLIGFCLGINNVRQVVSHMFVDYKDILFTFCAFCTLFSAVQIMRLKIQKLHLNIRNYSYAPCHSIDGPYDPIVIEQDWYKWWEKSNFFSPKNTLNKCFKHNRMISILPPPNITGTLHLGHALTISIQDALIRWERMRGKSVMWIPGMDHAGIATQSVVERFLLKTQNLKRKEMTRNEFLNEIWKWKDLHADYIYHQIVSMGASLDWSKQFFTLDMSLSKVVTDCFIQLYNEGLIYRDKKMVNWSCLLETAISDIEVDYKVISKSTEIIIRGEPVEFGVLHQVAYPLVNPSNVNEVVVSTSRVETIPGDKAISVNPNDTRFLVDLHGKYCYNPLNPDVIIPIIPDEMVDPNFGTGAVKITPAHDPKDYEFSIRHKIPILSIFDSDGRMNASCQLPELEHIDRLKCRKHILLMLKNKGLYRGFQSYETSIPLCSRSGDMIEYFLKSQWYLKTRPLALNVYDNYKAGKLKIIPECYSNEWIKWLENIEDWCISRQLWWGHRIPIWYVDCINGYWIAAETEETALKISGGKDVKQDLDVLDTWFSSALLPLSAFHWDSRNIPIEYPLNFIESGSDILFFWILRMALLCTHFTGKLPFNEIILHPLIRDSQGKKMSKSLGNVIDPLHIIKGGSLNTLKNSVINGNVLNQNMELDLKKKQLSDSLKAMGSDSLRFALINYTKQTRQINVDIENISAAKYVCSKLWNATKFFLNQMKHYDLKIINTVLVSTHIFDKYIIHRLSETINACNKGFELRKLFEVTKCLRKFIVYDLCGVYLEVIKQELKYDNSKRVTYALTTLYSVLYTVVKLLHPISPFITEELYQKLLLFDPYPEISIMISKYPDNNFSFYPNNDFVKRVENIMALVHEFRSMISSANFSNCAKFEGFIEINDRNRIFKDDVAEFKNDLNNDLSNMYSRIINSELILYLHTQDPYSNNSKQFLRIKWLRKQEETVSGKLKSEEYIRNAPKHIQEKDVKKLMDIQNELKFLIRNCEKQS